MIALYRAKVQAQESVMMSLHCAIVPACAGTLPRHLIVYRQMQLKVSVIQGSGGLGQKSKPLPGLIPISDQTIILFYLSSFRSQYPLLSTTLQFQFLSLKPQAYSRYPLPFLTLAWLLYMTSDLSPWQLLCLLLQCADSKWWEHATVSITSYKTC